MPRIRKKALSDLIAISKNRVWRIAIYIRLSRDDGNDESLSVSNQRKILLEYVEQSFQGEYVLVDIYIDDGQSGTDYDRPGFQSMLQDVEAGKVNCIICKNLSRAFRNYSDQGYFLESFFPRYDTRFITLGDPKVDTYINPESVNGMEVPINGLMNDRYAYKTSSDIRRTFDNKRRNGEFIGAFAPYGYKKDPNDKNSLIIDDEAAEVVKSIFHWFVNDGYSKNGIAQKLNQMGEPNPEAYKKRKGFKYQNPNSEKNDGLWSSCTIARILQNEVYIGNMVQGRHKIISYKVHKQIAVPENEWYVVPNTHEAIIDKEAFDKAQALHKRDMRTAPEKKQVYLLSGLVRCADCKKAMHRKTARGIPYYFCRSFTEKKICSKHSIREDKLISAVLAALQVQIALVDNLSEEIEKIANAPIINRENKRLSHSLAQAEKQLKQLNDASDSLYIDWKSGYITKDEYKRLKGKVSAQIQQQEQVISHLKDEIQAMADGIEADDPYLTAFLKHRNIESLNRGILVELVDTIWVHEGGEITIDFNFADEYQRIVDYIENNHNIITMIENREAV